MKRSIPLISAPLLLCALLASACSSPDGVTDPVDSGDAGDSGTPDGGTPACSETIPVGLVFADISAAQELARSHESPKTLPDGRILQPYGVAFGQFNGRIWDGTQWINTAISPAGANTLIGNPAFGAFGDRFIMAAGMRFPGDTTPAMYTYTETAPATFGSGETLPSPQSSAASQGLAYSSNSHRQGILVSANPGYIDLVEKSDGAPMWHTEHVASPIVGGFLSPIAAGYKSNGTAYAIVLRTEVSGATSTKSFVLYTRLGTAWSIAKTLYSNIPSNIFNWSVGLTPEGASERKLYLAWEEFSPPSFGTIKAIVLNVETESNGAVITLAPPKTVTTQNAIYPSFAVSPDGKSVIYSINDASSSQLWLGSSRDGESFSNPVPYHPELAHRNTGGIFFSRCGKPLLMHRSFEVGGIATSRLTIDELTPSEIAN